MKLIVPAFVVLCAFYSIEESETARILALIATPSYSHQIPYRKLWLELHKRGHEVVLLTTHLIPNMSNVTNFTQIDISGSYEVLQGINFLQLRLDNVNWVSFVHNHMFDMVNSFAENVFNNAEFKELYKPGSNQKFDVMLTELLYMSPLIVFSHRFDAPLIGLSSLGLISFNEYVLGGFVLPSHEYTWETEANTGSNLPFWKRLQNFVSMWHVVYMLHRDMVPHHQEMAEKYLETKVPPLLDIMRNTSLLFVNQAEALTPARSKLSNMITFSSFHIEENPPPMPKDLQRFVDNAKEGFIYFSLGSNARSSDMPKELLQVFIDVFTKLPYRVVWKYEKDMPGKPDNIFIGKWFSQQRILAHPNIKLFMYQGGLQSTEEAISFAIPLLGFAILADQDYTVGRIDALGAGKRLDLTTVTRYQLENAITEIITNKTYKEKVMELRTLIKDTPYDLVDNLVWWTEYVIRHKGAPHLRSNLAWHPWYQRYDIDIIIFLTIVGFVIVSQALNLFAKLIVLIHRQLNASTQKQKIS